MVHSRTQHRVMPSTTENEYAALSDIAWEIIFMRGLLEFLLRLQRGGVTVFEDNDGAVKLASNPICTNRMKHVGIRCHFVREKFDEKFMKVAHVSSSNQSADGSMKNLPV